MPETIIALVFDFDDTLTPDSTSMFLQMAGLDPRQFWEDQRARIADGWDQVPAYMQMMIEESEKLGGDSPYTRENFEKFGGQLKFFEGVTTLFSRLQEYVANELNQASIEFYIISSGIETLIRGSKIARHFTDMWGSEFDYDAAGRIRAIKRVISFTDKTRYLYQISKGLVGPQYRKDPFRVNDYVKSYRVPFENIIFVGDGTTDIPCFSLLKKYNGTPIAVYDRHSREKWGKAHGFVEDPRVKHVTSANFKQDSGLSDAILLSIDCIINRTRLQDVTYPG